MTLCALDTGAFNAMFVLTFILAAIAFSFYQDKRKLKKRIAELEGTVEQSIEIISRRKLRENAHDKTQ